MDDAFIIEGTVTINSTVRVNLTASNLLKHWRVSVLNSLVHTFLGHLPSEIRKVLSPCRFEEELLMLFVE